MNFDEIHRQDFLTAHKNRSYKPSGYMNKKKIIVAGIGPGEEKEITPAVREAIGESDVIIGYKYYFQFIKPFIREESVCLDTGMKRERERAEEAFRQALAGKTVCVISSGDAGIYGMAPLILEMNAEKGTDIYVEVLPGISAFQKAASLLGAPIGHDLCIISLSDLMTPWEKIEKRVEAAAYADFVTAIYNPRSEGRYWQLFRLKELFMKERSDTTPVGLVRKAGRPEKKITVTTLQEMNPNEVDMFTVILIGNSQSYIAGGKIITPRGYFKEEKILGRKEEQERPTAAVEKACSTEELKAGKMKIGQEIMMQSFSTIESMLKNRAIPLDKKWALIHTIHTTADFEMEDLLYTDDRAVATLYNKFSGKNGEPKGDNRSDKKSVDKTIITDVSMAAAGIRKGALERLGITVKCYLSDSRAIEMASTEGITRTQAGIRVAVMEHPTALYVFGNAPTALMELCKLIRRGKANPMGIIAAPVGFVHVKESKYMVKPFVGIPKIIIEGRKGGSNIAATLVNSILCFNDAEQLRPGRDL